MTIPANPETAFNLEARRIPTLIKVFIAIGVTNVLITLASLAIL